MACFGYARYSLKGNRRGAAMVEMAICLPLLLMLVFGMVDLGLVIKDYLALSQVAREGARMKALNYTGNVSTSVTSWADSLGLKSSLITYPSPPDVGSGYTALTLTYRHTMITWKLLGLSKDTVNLSSTMVMRVE